ncbi:MAG: type I-E CRISPR-associated protein Cse1/CasA [Desulfovibrionaceae bacterium]
MTYDCLAEPWLPVRRASGAREMIPPWKMTDGHATDPITTLDYPRPDFSGSMLQFLIGLVQTCCPPNDPMDWESRRDAPPDPETLRQAFAAKGHAFLLDGDGPRFMQDLSPLDKVGKTKPISILCIEAPGEQTLERNTDLFIKRGGIQRLCPACAAAALFTLQCNSPKGGRGHLTSLRGGGPLTTLVMGTTLWDTVWHNVLPMDRLAPLGDMAAPEAGGVFPWLAPTRTGERGSPTETTLPGDVHPLQAYWGMPRRIRLQFEANPDAAPCSLCAAIAPRVVRTCQSKTYGTNYGGPWLHPLTPYTVVEGEAPNPRKGKDICWRDWLGLVDTAQDKNTRRSPAAVVQAFRERIADARALDDAVPDFRIHAFGYELKDATPRAWVEGVVPVYVVDAALRERYAEWIERYVQCAGLVLFALRGAVAAALFSRENKPDAKSPFMRTLSERFWAGTTQPFAVFLRQLRRCLAQGDPDQAQRRDWVLTLTRQAERLFADVAENGDFAASDPKKYADGLLQLRRYNSLKNKKIMEFMQLETS